MIECIHCGNARNPDTATNCNSCKQLLHRRGATFGEDEFTPQRSRTAVEDVMAGGGRRRTVAEGVSESNAYPTPTAESQLPGARRNEPSYQGGHGMAAGTSGSASPRMSGVKDQGRRSTKFIGMPEEEPTVTPTAPRSPAVPGIGGVRRIVGILITYSWEEQGQVFPVLEGRNLIGKDPTQCNICIPQDQTLSDVNSSIAYRSQFVIRDKDSMSGTFVDGAFVEAEPIPLRNYAKIRTGSTNWTFVAIQPQTATGTTLATDPAIDA